MDYATPKRDPRSRFEAKLREVEEDLARLRGARELMVAAGAHARAVAGELAGDTIDHTSDDGVATVSCDGRGQVAKVEFDKAGYNRVDDKQLCASVLQARHRARERARRESAAVSRDLSHSGPATGPGV